MGNQAACEEKSIEQVIGLYKNMVFKITLTHTSNRLDAEDAFQQTFLAYYQKDKTFSDEEHRKAWLIRTALNCSRRITQSSWKKKTVSLEETSDGCFQFVSEEENLVYRSVMELPEKYRTVILLYYFEDLPSEEIALILKRKSGTVRMQLMRGREMLREKLKGDYFDET